MALGRELDVYVGSGDVANILSKKVSTKISTLDMSFNIVRSNRLTENKANFKIYNAGRDTRNEILKRGNNIICDAGYTDEKNISMIYAGNITEVYSYKTNTEWITEIEATTYRSKDKNNESINVSLAYTAPSKARQDRVYLSRILKDIATLLGLTIVGTENTDSIELPNGFHFLGSLGSALKTAALFAQVKGVSFCVDNNELLLFKINEPTIASSVLLRYGGTLLSIKETSDSKSRSKKKKKELTLEALLDPRFAPNASIYVDTAEHSGEYLISEVNFYGDNFGGSFNSKLQVQSVK